VTKCGYGTVPCVANAGIKQFLVKLVQLWNSFLCSAFLLLLSVVHSLFLTAFVLKITLGNVAMTFGITTVQFWDYAKNVIAP
jgi:hypothetical protein